MFWPSWFISRAVRLPLIHRTVTQLLYSTHGTSPCCVDFQSIPWVCLYRNVRLSHVFSLIVLSASTLLLLTSSCSHRSNWARLSSVINTHSSFFRFPSFFTFPNSSTNANPAIYHVVWALSLITTSLTVNMWASTPCFTTSSTVYNFTECGYILWPPCVTYSSWHHYFPASSLCLTHFYYLDKQP